MKRTPILLATATVGLFGLGAIVQPTVGGSPVAVAVNVEGVCQPQGEHSARTQGGTTPVVTTTTTPAAPGSPLAAVIAESDYD